MNFQSLGLTFAPLLMQGSLHMAQKYRALNMIVGSVGLIIATYLPYVVRTWLSYGRTSKTTKDILLDCFMPDYHVREHHRVRVAAPADVALRAACEMDMSDSRLVNAVFKGRQLIMRGHEQDKALKGSMVKVMKSIGWVVLDEIPGLEIVLGTGAKPWVADGDFRSIRSDEFQLFQEPQYVKIALTLKAEPINPSMCYLSTETRAVATDEFARKRFRLYWAFLSPGIRFIRWPMLARARKIAEQTVRTGKIAA